MTRTPAELEPGIEASRQALARDVAALRGRTTPRRLLDDAVATARIQGRRTGAQVLKTANSRPFQLSLVGAVLAGVGAWLLVRLIASRRRPKTLPERIKAATWDRTPWA
jgi:hypothetical protein